MNTSSMNFSSLSFSPASLQCLHPGSDPYTILILQCLQLDLNFRTFDVLYVLDFEVYNDYFGFIIAFPICGFIFGNLYAFLAGMVFVE